MRHPGHGQSAALQQGLGDREELIIVIDDYAPQLHWASMPAGGSVCIAASRSREATVQIALPLNGPSGPAWES